MTRFTSGILSLALSTVFALTACEHEHDHDHADHAYDQVPDEYRELANPYAGDQRIGTRGGATFAGLCSDCHGADAAGDGPRAEAMDPSPTDLLELVADPLVTDGYVFWRIAEGGLETGTSMPAWASELDGDETWEVITYLQCHVSPCDDRRSAAEVAQ